MARLGSGLLVAGLVLLGVACAPGAADVRPTAVPQHGGVLRLAQEAPQSLDPLEVDSVYESLPANQVFDGLVALGPSLQIVPALAETWTVGRDGTEYVFELRRGVTFHDGSPVTAADVQFSIERVLAVEPELRTVAFPYLLSIAGARELADGRAKHLAGLTIDGEHRVHIRLVERSPTFLEALASIDVSIVPRARVAGREDAFARAPVGTGPFRVERWDRNALRLAANPDHFRGRPFVDALEIRFASARADQESHALLAGDLDVIEPSGDQLLLLERDPAVRVQRHQELSLAFLGMNTALPPLDLPEVRQAIGHAIDRERLVADSPAVRRSATGILPPGISAYSPEEKALAHDPARARELLARAGHPDGEGLPAIVLWTSRPSPSVERTIERIREDLEQVGLRLEVRHASWTELDAALEEGRAPAFLLGWVADLTDPDPFLRSLFESGGSDNYFSFRDLRTQELLAQGAGEANPVDRARIYRTLERQLLEAAPLVPLYHTVGVVAMREDVHGLVAGPLGIASVEFERVWIDPRKAGA